MRKLKEIRWAFAIALLAMTPSLSADDTEIYVGFSNANDGAQPNVMFVMDSSASMNANVIVTENFNPAQTYSGSCQTSRIYWRLSSQSVPGCASDRYFNASRLRCDAAAVPLDLAAAGVGTGFYQDRVARWRDHPTNNNRDRWRPLNDNIHNPPHVECKADNGSHGVDGTSTETYIKNGPTGPWKTGAANSTNWNNVGAVYTLYSGNYLNWFHNHQTTNLGTRLTVVKDVLKDLVDSVSDVNIGLMRFDSHLYSGFQNRDAQGGPVLFPLTDIDAGSTRVDFKTQVDTLTAQGSTPITETLWEAMLYYRGDDVHYGAFPINDYQSVPASLDPANSSKYKNPIEYECAKNFIVLLSDGEPTADDNADSFINSTVSGVAGLDLGSCGHGPDYVSGANDDTCFDELAEYMYEVDHATPALGNDLPGTQNIITYTVGFGLQTFNDFLESAAEEGGGKSYFANDAQELGVAFTDIVSEILSVNTTFTAPALSVNAFNRITNNKELYFALFKPDDGPHWPGNVKKFEIGLVDGDPEFLDASDPQQVAVDPNTGFFKPDTKSFWTQAHDAPDGDSAIKGGMASRLYDILSGPQHDVDSRKVYTYTGGTTPAEKSLTHADNKLHEDNAFTEFQSGTNNPNGKITPALMDMGVTDEATENEFLRVVKWARGLDVDDEDEDGLTTDAHTGMGAPLHSKPALVTYSKTGPVAGTQKDILFTVTNGGYLHAAEVNEAPGNTDTLELFSFVPQQLLQNLDLLYENTPGSQSSPTSSIEYGLDGDIEVWTRDVDGDLEIEPADGDHVRLYFGQRRGGRAYFALDVSDLADPKVMWTIIGGVTTGFDELSETWSKPERHRMELLVGGTIVVKDVIVFGAGYDDGHDLESTARDPNGDATGRAIYIVDAETGDLLWWAGFDGLTSPAPDLGLSEMRYSIPAEIRVVDVNGDGKAERMYAGDMGGQLFRFDVLDDGTISGGRIADLQDIDGVSGASPAIADNRRFFYPPDIALIRPFDSPDFLSIAIGSGYRAHPLNKEVKDHFYMLRDYHVLSPPTVGESIDYSVMAVTEGDLLDVTNQPALDPETLSSFDLADFNNGWFLVLKDLGDGSFDGEKVIAKALTAEGKILFTTFTPVSDSGQQTDACAPSQGLGKLYAINVEDGTPVQNLDGVGAATNLTETDRVYELTRSGIPPEVIVVFPPIEGVDPLAIVGAEIADIDLSNAAIKTYWFQDNVH